MHFLEGYGKIPLVACARSEWCNKRRYSGVEDPAGMIEGLKTPPLSFLYYSTVSRFVHRQR